MAKKTRRPEPQTPPLGLSARPVTAPAEPPAAVEASASGVKASETPAWPDAVTLTLDGLTLPFEGGATLHLKAQIDPGQQVVTGASVVQVFERQNRLELHFGQGLPAGFTLTNPGNAVAVRDATGRVVYLG